MSSTRRFLLLALLLVPLAAQAQIPRGPEFQITPAGTASEVVTGVAVAENGEFLLVWTVRPRQGPLRVRFRLFHAGGAPRSPELGVGAPPWDQLGGRIALRADGRFVLVWTERVPGHSRVLGRLFAPTLRPLGPAFRLTPELRGNQDDPDVAMAADGRFIAVWSSDHAAALPRDTPDIFARRFSPAGKPLGPEFLVNAGDTFEEQWAPRVAAGVNGDFVVLWESWEGEGEFYDAKLQRFAADGSPRGEELALAGSQGTELSQVGGAVAMAEDGGFLAVCTDFGGDFERPDAGPLESEDFFGIVGRRFAADGTPVGGLVHVNDAAPGLQQSPDVVRRPGGFYVVWASSGDGERPGGIFARRLRLNGTPAAGGDLRVSTSGARQSGPVVALNSQGRGVVAWTETDAGPNHFRVLARYLLPRNR